MNDIANILLLHDYKGFFAGAFVGTREKHVSGKMDVEFMLERFRHYGYHAEACSFSKLDFSRDYSGWYVLYASSEERGLFYKSYIEDIILWLHERGAVLIPSFKYFKAHHNKCFAELLRNSFVDESLRMPAARCFGNYQELLQAAQSIDDYPCVIKTSAGSGSGGVRIARTREELLSVAKKLSGMAYSDAQYPWYKANKALRAVRNGLHMIGGNPHLAHSGALKSNKFIVQRFIPGLSGDYKVLYFGGKYYVLRRENRDGDFRASGSGKFTYPDDADKIKPVLECAGKAVSEIKTPLCSLDIATNDNGTYLLEFQCLCFGPYTIQYSPHYLIYDRGTHSWSKVMGESVIEEELCRSVNAYIQGELSYP